MNKYQKEIIEEQLRREQELLKRLKKVYEQAERDIDRRINLLLARKDVENLQSIIYQVDYQRALKKQIGAILDSLNNKQFESISKYLTECYENGFLGVLYDIQKQGVPLIFPIDQDQVVKALTVDTKLSKRLYTKLGEDVADLKKTIQNELARGISQAYAYEKIAKNIRNYTSIGFNRSMRIARTEGHRITQAATLDAQHKAKEVGADIVKQWDSTLDSRTRKMHVELDGQIRELEDPFEVGIFKAQYPGNFGVPGMDIHCRCVLLQRARWAIKPENVDYTKFDGNKGKLVNLSDAGNFAAFKARYKSSI